MPVRVIAYTPVRRLLRRTAQTMAAEALLAALKRPAIRHAMLERVAAGETCELFREVEIETINRCNGTCPFCPVNARDDSRTPARMDGGLFTRIVGQLAALQYAGLIGLSSNNEPFLDRELVARIAECRAACPRARLYLYTNGTLLDPETALRAVSAGLDKMVIDDYSDNLVMSANVRQVVGELDRPENAWAAPRVDVAIRRRNERLRNRGGRAPNKPSDRYGAFALYAAAGCTKPFRQLVIRPTGEVSLCCNDALGELTLGDVRREGLLDVWNGPAFREVRRLLLTRGRRGIGLCAHCDVTCLGIREAIRRRWPMRGARGPAR